MPRDYAPLIETAPTGLTREEAMRRAVQLLWGAFANRPISWVGFYEKVPESDEMVLVCREPKPACSPIGLQGMCGKSYLTRRPILIDDVRTLGENYIACDPNDQSELVVPLVDAHGVCSGVLDVDSYDIAAFDEADVGGMTNLLVRLGLTQQQPAALRL